MKELQDLKNFTIHDVHPGRKDQGLENPGQVGKTFVSPSPASTVRAACEALKVLEPLSPPSTANSPTPCKERKLRVGESRPG